MLERPEQTVCKSSLMLPRFVCCCRLPQGSWSQSNVTRPSAIARTPAKTAKVALYESMGNCDGKMRQPAKLGLRTAANCSGHPGRARDPRGTP